jgi:hypothetical protein
MKLVSILVFSTPPGMMNLITPSRFFTRPQLLTRV